MYGQYGLEHFTAVDIDATKYKYDMQHEISFEMRILNSYSFCNACENFTTY